MRSEDARAIAVDGLTGSPLARAPRLLAPGCAIRILARLRRSALDRALAQGADPSSCSQVAARAAQLAGSSSRVRRAATLERLALVAEGPTSRVRVSPSRLAVHANRAELLELAATLRREDPLYARGIAALELLVTDGTGPMYTDRRGEALARQLQLARAGLSGSVS